jgi:uncharacterized protein
MERVMPANLTPTYIKAEVRHKEAKTPEEKIETLEVMIAELPKHKGTDKLFGELKKRLSKLRNQESKGSGATQQVSPYKISRAGAGMAVLVGAPNSGKSAIVAALTKAQVTVAEFPFSTRLPIPGMMSFENAKIQIVDTPPVSEDFFEPDLPGLLRKADLVLLCLDASDPAVLDGMDGITTILEQAKVKLAPEAAPAPEPGEPVSVKTFVVVTKIDCDGGAETVDVLAELLPGFHIIPISAETGTGMPEFARDVFYGLDVVRAYTKTPGKKPDLNDPVYLKRGQTLLDFARDIHKDFAENLKFARIWGEGKYDGQTVNRDHEVNDGDVLELHL